MYLHTVPVNWFRQCITSCTIIRVHRRFNTLVNKHAISSLLFTSTAKQYERASDNEKRTRTHSSFEWIERKKSSALLNKLNDHVTRATAVNSNDIARHKQNGKLASTQAFHCNEVFHQLDGATIRNYKLTQHQNKFETKQNSCKLM